ncbi:hypothetical protein V6N11_082491 [Hibiscus sabdariffa]|uniref:Uncharacterized protein n=1 Tax=Hibiscus sabdariffa TaxID=183260 RepID=A0ABR2PCQ1_9ROSI
MITWCGGEPPLLNLIGKSLRRRDEIALWELTVSELTSPSKNKWQEWEEYYSMIMEKSKESVFGSSLPEKPKCSGILTLTLTIQANSSARFPPKFFADMPDLQVLCLGQTGIDALPPSISKLKKLLPIQLPWVSAASSEDGGSRNPCFTSYRDLLFAEKDWRIE